MKPRSFITDALVRAVLDDHDEKWRRARRMMRQGYSAERIAELTDLDLRAVKIAKQAGEW